MRYYLCLTCYSKHKLLLNEQLLNCSCGEYDKNLLIECDKEWRPLKKEGMKNGDKE